MNARPCGHVRFKPLCLLAFRFGRRAAARKATAFANASGPRARGLLSEPLPCRVAEKNSAPGPLRFPSLDRPTSPVPEGKQNGRPTPPTEKVIMTATLEHLDPAALLIGENVCDTAALDSPRCSNT